MKKIALVIFLITNLFSLDITEAVKLGLEKKSKFMNTDQKLEGTRQIDDTLDMRLVYLKFLEDRQNLYIVDGAIKKAQDIKADTSVFDKDKEKYENVFTDTKSLLESLIGQNIEDINSVKSINLSDLKNDSLEALIDKSLENSSQIQSLEKDLYENDSKKSDSSWNVDVGGEVRYRYDTAKRSNGRSFKGNEVELGLSIVLSKNSGAYENDSTIEIAKKRSDLEKKKASLKQDVLLQREEYIKALQEYKNIKKDLNKYDVKNLKTQQEINEAYNIYIKKTEALYNAYKKYARLLYIVEKSKD